MAAKKLFRCVTAAPAFVEDEVSKFFVEGYDLINMSATLTSTGNGGTIMAILVFKLRGDPARQASALATVEPAKGIRR